MHQTCKSKKPRSLSDHLLLPTEKYSGPPGGAEAHLTAPCLATEMTPGTAAGTRRETRRTSAGAGAGLKKLRREAEATQTHACNQHVPLVLMCTICTVP